MDQIFWGAFINYCFFFKYSMKNEEIKEIKQLGIFFLFWKIGEQLLINGMLKCQGQYLYLPHAERQHGDNRFGWDRASGQRRIHALSNCVKLDLPHLGLCPHSGFLRGASFRASQKPGRKRPCLGVGDKEIFPMASLLQR